MSSRRRSPLALVSAAVVSAVLMSTAAVTTAAPASADTTSAGTASARTASAGTAAVSAGATSGEAFLREQVARAEARRTAALTEATTKARLADAAQTTAARRAAAAATARTASGAATTAAVRARAAVQTTTRAAARARAAVRVRSTSVTRARAAAAARAERVARARATSVVRSAKAASARATLAIAALEAAKRAAKAAEREAELAADRAAAAKAEADAAAAAVAAVVPSTAPTSAPTTAPTTTPTTTAPVQAPVQAPVDAAPLPLPSGATVDEQPPAPSAAPVPTVAPTVAPTGLPTSATATPLRPFAGKGTAFYTPIPANPRLDPDNDAVVAAFAKKGEGRVLNVEQYGQPIYTATPTTPRYDLVVTNAGTGPGMWGHNDLEQDSVPIPDDAVPSPGMDGKLVVIDPVNRKVYDMWQAKRAGATWSVSWGGVYDLDGDGSSHNVRYGSGPNRVAWPKPVTRGTGSGISSAAGVLRIEEVVAGRADHALVFSTNMPCGPNDSANHRFPATATDGWLVGAPCLPQGARLQLDPTIDLAKIPGITQIELVVGRALQTYGAYAMDQGGARMAVVSEVPANPAEEAVYARAGVTWDYFGLIHLPWDKVRVLASYDGS